MSEHSTIVRVHLGVNNQTQQSDTSAELLTDGLATVREAANFLSLGRSKLYVMMDRGELVYCKFGDGPKSARRIPWVAIRRLAADSLIGIGVSDDRAKTQDQ